MGDVDMFPNVLAAIVAFVLAVFCFMTMPDFIEGYLQLNAFGPNTRFAAFLIWHIGVVTVVLFFPLRRALKW